MRIPNGIALCALRHAAFDRDLKTVRPDYYQPLLLP